MNAYTRNQNTEGVSQEKLQSSRVKLAGFAARISGMIVLIFIAIAAQMHLRVEIERMNKRSTEIRAEISMLNVQCTNLRNRKEKLTSWQNIQNRIQNYGLGLREAEHNQISYITLEPPRAVRKTLRPVQKTARRGDANRGKQIYAQSTR